MLIFDQSTDNYTDDQKSVLRVQSLIKSIT